MKQVPPAKHAMTMSNYGIIGVLYVYNVVVARLECFTTVFCQLNDRIRFFSSFDILIGRFLTNTRTVDLTGFGRFCFVKMPKKNRSL